MLTLGMIGKVAAKAHNISDLKSVSVYRWYTTLFKETGLFKIKVLIQFLFLTLLASLFPPSEGW